MQWYFVVLAQLAVVLLASPVDVTLYTEQLVVVLREEGHIIPTAMERSMQHHARSYKVFGVVPHHRGLLCAGESTLTLQINMEHPC